MQGFPGVEDMGFTLENINKNKDETLNMRDR